MHPGRNISEELQKLLDVHDFAICLLTGDRDSGQPGKYLPSENVVFEAGLCYGSLGPKRTFLFCHEDQHRNLPADVGGDIDVSYKESDDLAKKCSSIANAITREGRRIRPPRMFRQFNEAFGSIGKQLSRGLDADGAELIQHSSVRASVLVEQLINRHVDIDMYLQHPDVIGYFSMHRKDRITDQINLYINDYLGDGKYRGHFRIYYYRTPASFSGVRIHLRRGRNLFFVSWYTYSALDEKRLWQAGKASGIRLTGGENPCIEVDDGSAESEAISQLFEKQRRSVLCECPEPVVEFRDGKVIRCPES